MKKRVPKILLAAAIASAFIISSCADKGMNDTNPDTNMHNSENTNYNTDTTKNQNQDTIKDMNDSIP
jgi:hypothetical protein